MPGYKSDGRRKKKGQGEQPLALCSFLGVIGHCQGHCTDHSRPRPSRGIIDQAARNPSKDFPPNPRTNHLLPASVVRPMSQRVTMATEHPFVPKRGYRCMYTIFALSSLTVSLVFSLEREKGKERPDAFGIAKPSDPSIPRDNLINVRLIASVFNFNVHTRNRHRWSCPLRVVRNNSLSRRRGIVNAHRNCFRFRPLSWSPGETRDRLFISKRSAICTRRFDGLKVIDARRTEAVETTFEIRRAKYAPRDNFTMSHFGLSR